MKPSSIIIICCLFVSCGGKNKQLDYRTRDLIDSLTREQNRISAKEIDEFCRDSFDILVQKAVDSLLIVRQREIEKTIGKKTPSDTTGSHLNF